MGEVGEFLLDADLRGVGDPDLAVEHADDQRDMLAFQPDAPLLEQLDHALDVVRAAGDAGTDQTPAAYIPSFSWVMTAAVWNSLARWRAANA